MKVLIKRWLTYTLVPVGIALLLVPFFTTRIEEQPGEVFVLSLLPMDGTSGVPVTLGEIADFPNLRLQVEIMRLNTDSSPLSEVGPIPLETVPPQEWREFSDRIQSTTFNLDGLLFGGRVFDKIERVEVPANKTLLLTAGVIILFMGLLEWVFLYRPTSGGSRAYVSATVLTSDIVVVLLGVIFTWWILDLLLEQYFSFSSFWGDDPIRLMGVFWVVAIVPFMTLWVSAYYPKKEQAK